MNKVVFASLFIVLSSIVSLSQSSDYNKFEVFGGYSHGQIDSGVDSGNSVPDFFRDRRPFHGFEASGVYNFSRYLGVKADVSGTYNSTRVAFSIPDPTGPASTVSFDSKNSVYNFLGGIQVKDNASEARFKPFAHAMIGAGHLRSKISNTACTGSITCSSSENSQTGFAGAFGGGLDIKLSKRVDFRALQVDYNPIRLDGSTQNNVRFGIGFVFK